ncbi:hypothetical protein CHS0354_028504 [Potamilus streckersoni]|uniref:Uncharacterized protein n=1 Tax=Potamilus streckersoni TaxID=2493646 RepID=A0AAE0SED5_9BIVA|nr:hypothetical protein CHS0354_028504 [Potamilus streckersoni]
MICLSKYLFSVHSTIALQSVYINKKKMFPLKPSEIFYSQDSINNIFTGGYTHRGKPIGDTLDELADGQTTVQKISTISVIDINGKWFSCDNRRLWVFKQFEFLGGCTYIPVFKTMFIDRRKFTTLNEGKSIRVRGSPGGNWYYKLIKNPAKYKNCLQGVFIDPYIAMKVSTSKPPSYPQEDNSEEYLSIKRNIETPNAFGFRSNLVFGYDEQSDLNRTASATAQMLHRGSTPSLQISSPDQIFGKFGLNSAVPSSHSANISAGTNMRNNTERVEGLMPYTTPKSSERPTSSYENKPGSNVSIVQYQKKTTDTDQYMPSNINGSTLHGTRTVRLEGRTQKLETKLKPASRQVFTQLINVKQMKVNAKIPVTIILDPSEIRYTKEAIEYPPGNKRWPTVQRRILDLLEAENQKLLEVYKAYNMYWVKEENDVLWSLKEHPEWRKTKINLKVLVIEDNDSFLDFMRKEKPWLQISDILQFGHNIELIK